MSVAARPLGGVTVVVTRARTQSSALSEKLAELGASPLTIATIAIAEPSDGGAGLRRAARDLAQYAQIVVASPNGARVLVESVAAGATGRLPPVACVGPSTAAVLDGSPLTVNIVPDRAVAEGLVDAMPRPGANRRVLLLQAEIARDVIENGLSSRGWLVDRIAGYRTIDAEVTDDDRAAARTGDVITFTSSSTVERFVRLVGRDALPPVVASIGPITSVTARHLGLTVDIQAEVHTIDGLVDALVGWASR